MTFWRWLGFCGHGLLVCSDDVNGDSLGLGGVAGRTTLAASSKPWRRSAGDR